MAFHSVEQITRKKFLMYSPIFVHPPGFEWDFVEQKLPFFLDEALFCRALPFKIARAISFCRTYVKVTYFNKCNVF